MKKSFLIYSYGKVGTQSVFEHLIKNNKEVYYAHTEKLFYEKYNFNITELFTKKVLIIIGTRDSIDQSISSLFQNISNEKGHDKEIIMGERNEILDMKTSKIINFFLEKKLHFRPLFWFENINLFFKNLKIDIPKINNDKKYELIGNENIEVFIYKFKYLQELSQIINKITECNGEISVKNSSEKKWYADKIKDFKSKIKFSKKELSEIYRSKYSSYFLEKKDIEYNCKKYSYYKIL